MISFDNYVGEYVVLITNSFDSLDDISGIRINNSRVFKYKNQWVIARQLTLEDIKDIDFLMYLSSIWQHDELKLKSFIRHKVVNEEEEIYPGRDQIQRQKRFKNSKR